MQTLRNSNTFIEFLESFAKFFGNTYISGWVNFEIPGFTASVFMYIIASSGLDLKNLLVVYPWSIRKLLFKTKKVVIKPWKWSNSLKIKQKFWKEDETASTAENGMDVNGKVCLID